MGSRAGAASSKTLPATGTKVVAVNLVVYTSSKSSSKVSKVRAFEGRVRYTMWAVEQVCVCVCVCV